MDIILNAGINFSPFEKYSEHPQSNSRFVISAKNSSKKVIHVIGN